MTQIDYLKQFSHWTRKRHIVHVGVLLTYLLLPQSLPLDGFQNGILKFDFAAWRIHFFGMTLVPGMFHIFFLAVLVPLFLVAISSALYSKVFCGWVCPQNIFFELFEGIKEYIKKRYPRFRKSIRLQNGLDLLMSLGMGLILAYVTTLYFQGASPIFYAAVFLFVSLFFTYDIHWLKHKFCQNACPYAFIQKSFQKKNSLHVQWEDRPGNKCGVCTACVKACYVDLDIKKDTYHLDCTMCGACVDACERVYSKRPEPALLKFSFEEQESKPAFLGINTATKAFIISSFLIFVSFFIWAVVMRPTADFRVDYPMSGTAHQIPFFEKGIHTNVYMLHVRNMSSKEQGFQLALDDQRFKVIWEDNADRLKKIPAFESVHATFKVHFNSNDPATVTPIAFELHNLKSGASLGKKQLLFRAAKP